MKIVKTDLAALQKSFSLVNPSGIFQFTQQDQLSVDQVLIMLARAVAQERREERLMYPQLTFAVMKGMVE